MTKAKGPKATGRASRGPRPKNWAVTDSVFWNEVQKSKDEPFKLAVQEIVDDSASLAKLVVTALPHFTLHDETHLLNVLYWMEQFITPAGLKVLEPVGCALCILLAYVHDLGMVPGPGWEEKIKDATSVESAHFRRFVAERHADLQGILDKFGNNPTEEQKRQKEWIEGFLKVDYLRVTHAEHGVDGRIAKHLECLGGENLKEPFRFLGAKGRAVKLVADLAASHNQPANWIAKHLEKEHGQAPGDYWKFHAKAGTANVVLPTLLLRLADICDFDASRTPPILFHQLGIEGFQILGVEKLKQAKRVTRGEWMKHLAVDRWEWNESGRNELCYIAGDCPHPAVEKSIHQFCGFIGTEIQNVRRELDRVFHGAGAAWLRLPESVKATVTARGYVYKDIEFKLQAHQVTELLMGTALYGNRELCIRELLQNSLDAVQLRDLRQQLKAKLEDLGRERELPSPVDAWTTDERKHPKITLNWGKDEKLKREWIRVTDLGTGMTEDQVQRYLSALGRSYYKSPEFDAERQLMRKHGLFSTPISQFGIGILSCFMVADWVEIRTCPCQPDKPDRKAWHIRITGPGVLFHFSELRAEDGQPLRPGTRVTLFLKSGFSVLEIGREDLLQRLRDEFSYTEPSGYVQRKEDFDKEKVHFNPAQVAARHVIWPRYDIQAGPEGETPSVMNSMCGAGAGVFVWLDACGGTAPRLTADRSTGLAPSGTRQSDWMSGVKDLFTRWVKHLASEIDCRNNRSEYLNLVVAVAKFLRPDIRPPDPIGPKWDLAKSNVCSWSTRIKIVVPWVVGVYIQQLSHNLGNGRTLDLARDRDGNISFCLTLARGANRDNDRALVRIGDSSRALALDLALARASGHDLGRARAVVHDLTPVHAVDRALDSVLERAPEIDRNRAFRNNLNEALQVSFLNEAFWPSLTESFQPLHLPTPLEGISAASHIAPTVLRFCGDDGPENVAANRWLKSRYYDLLFPFSAVAGGPLRSRFRDWERVRDWRSVATLPFLIPENEELTQKLSAVIRRDERGCTLTNNGIFALLPRSGLWERPFADWSEEECHWCGYSAWWDIAHGRTLWAVGAVKREEIAACGLPIGEFLKSAALAEYKRRCPDLFEEG